MDSEDEDNWTLIKILSEISDEEYLCVITQTIPNASYFMHDVIIIKKHLVKIED
jgi:hypothetical protein